MVGLKEKYQDYFKVGACVSPRTIKTHADAVTWLDGFPVPGRKNWPLLFDVNHEPKEAFHRVMKF